MPPNDLLSSDSLSHAYDNSLVNFNQSMSLFIISKNLFSSEERAKHDVILEARHCIKALK